MKHTSHHGGQAQISRFENVATIEELKSRKEQSGKEKIILDYLRILTFSELIDETSEVIKELNDTPFNSDLAIRGRLVLKELEDRLEAHSQEISKPFFNQIRKILEQKLLEIQNFL